jgi:hypothetical protein
MATLGSSEADAILKDVYSGQSLEELTFRNRPMFAWVPKNTGATGRRIVQPIRFANPGGRSRTPSTALGSSNTQLASKYESFDMTYKTDFAAASVDGLEVRRTKNDLGAFLDAMTAEMDGVMEAMADNMEFSLFNTSDGIRGICSSTSTTTCTLTKAADAFNFEVNMEVGAAATGPGTARSGTTTLVGVNRASGVLTSDATWTSDITSFTATDELFVAGDYTSATSDLCISGLKDWLPATAPGSTAYYGVDRTADLDRLSGTRHTGTSQTVEQALIELTSKVAAMGGRPDTAMLNHVQYRTLAQELGSKATYEQVQGAGSDGGRIANVAFEAVVIRGDAGPVKVIPANKCAPDRAYVLQRDTWVLHSIGQAIRLADEDGNAILRASDNDAFEVRVASHANLGCKNPGANGVATLTIPS